MSPTENPKDILKIVYQFFKGGEHRGSMKYEGRYDMDDGVACTASLGCPDCPGCFMHATHST
jgi:hypothetical protein